MSVLTGRLCKQIFTVFLVLSFFAISLISISQKAYARLDAKTFEQSLPVAEFQLEDHEGKPFNNERLKGQWTLILLGYTNCPDVCPFTLGNLAAVMDQVSVRVSPNSMPTVVFVGVDPERDKPLLADYVRHFRDDFVGATGEWKQIKAMVEHLKGFVRLNKKSADDTAYDVRHSSYVYIINPEGNLSARMNPPFQPVMTAEFLATLFRAYRKQSRQVGQ